MTAILSGNYAPLDEMHRLVASSLAGNMSHEEKDRLEELVKQDIESRSLYLDVIHETSILLTWAMCGGPNGDGYDRQSADPEKSDRHRANTCSDSRFPRPHLPCHSLFHPTLGYFSSGWPVAYLMATVIFGIGLLIGCLDACVRPGAGCRAIAISRTEQVAPSQRWRLSARLPVWWIASGLIRAPRPFMVRVPLGRKYALASGLMEITYDTGAKVILAGAGKVRG